MWNFILPVVAIVVAGLSVFINYLTWQRTKQVDHCITANAQVITEFDAILAAGKFPTDAQQDSWKRLTAGCAE